jgi:hypothetical protein
MDRKKHKKVSKKWLKYVIADEKKASKDYKAHGFKNLARDEAKHRRFLLKYKKKLKKVI